MINWKLSAKGGSAPVGKSEAKRENVLKSDKYNPVILELLKNRGIVGENEIEKFLNPSYGDLSDPLKIAAINKACERIILARDKKEKVAIFGDYDADGVTACAILYEALKDLGFKDVICYIPDRQLEGYGMNEKAVEYLRQEKVNLIITVDCGITGFKEVAKAKELGIDVIITDHHAIPEILPQTEAVINPNLENSGFSFSGLAGVGVAFKLVQALYQKISPEKTEQLKWALDLVAIGTVADCVPLLDENRILTKYGLVVLSKTRRIGLQEIFKVGAMKISENNPPDAHQVAYMIAPRINAAGRMDHANTAYKLVIEKNRVMARDLALEVEAKNQERQKVTSQIVKEIEILAKSTFSDKKLIFVESTHWPVGILGLAAGKISEQFRKPTLVFQKDEKGYRGSARSIAEIDMMDCLKDCRDLLEKFGGHRQAAGVVVSRENFNQFYEKLSGLIEKKLAGKEISSLLEIDQEINPEEINWDLMEEIKKMEPFGEGNSEPVFLMKNTEVLEAKICGNGSKHLKLSLRGAGGSPKIFDSIGFGMGNNSSIKNGDKIDIVFNLREDSWNGNKKIQLRLVDLKLK